MDEDGGGVSVGEIFGYKACSLVGSEELVFAGFGSGGDGRFGGSCWGGRFGIWRFGVWRGCSPFFMRFCGWIGLGNEGGGVWKGWKGFRVGWLVLGCEC